MVNLIKHERKFYNFGAKLNERNTLKITVLIQISAVYLSSRNSRSLIFRELKYSRK